jgi:hypothetical protein
MASTCMLTMLSVLPIGSMRQLLARQKRCRLLQAGCCNVKWKSWAACAINRRVLSWLFLGGSKVSDKLAVIKALQERVDALIIGGGMCFTFLRQRVSQLEIRCVSPTTSTLVAN